MRQLGKEDGFLLGQAVKALVLNILRKVVGLARTLGACSAAELHLNPAEPIKVGSCGLAREPRS